MWRLRSSLTIKGMRNGYAAGKTLLLRGGTLASNFDYVTRPHATKRPGIVVSSAIGVRVALIVALSGFLPAVATAAERNGEFEAYVLRHAQVGDIEPLVRQTLAALPDKTEVAVDAQGNRLLVRGSADAQQLVQALVRSLDKAGPAPQATQPILKSYPHSGPGAAQLAARVQAEFGDDRRVRVAADARTGQILVVAPAAAQEAIARRLVAEQGEEEAAPRGEQLGPRRADNESDSQRPAPDRPAAPRIRHSPPGRRSLSRSRMSLPARSNAACRNCGEGGWRLSRRRMRKPPPWSFAKGRVSRRWKCRSTGVRAT